MGKAENYVEDYLHQQAAARGWQCYKFAATGTTGVPDRIVVTDLPMHPSAHSVCEPGATGAALVFFVETKAAAGQVSERQKQIINQLRATGAIVHVTHTREEVDAVLTDPLGTHDPTPYVLKNRFSI